MSLSEEVLVDCYRRQERSLFNVLFRVVWNQAEAEDLVQEAFLRVWAVRSKVDTATLDALVFKTGLNLAKNFVRWRLNWNKVGIEDFADMIHGGESIEDKVAATEIATVMRDALTRLPTRQRDTILLTEFSGLTLDQIGRMLGVPPGTVASRRHTALRNLREYLGDEPCA